MPVNFKGKKFDLRPYIDERGWLVIRRGPNVGRFKIIKGKLKYTLEGYYHIDRYNLEMMKKQARKLIPIMVKNEI